MMSNFICAACGCEQVSLTEQVVARDKRIAELEGALRPFAAMMTALDLIQEGKPGADAINDDKAFYQTWGPKSTPKAAQLTFGHLRAARAALSEETRGSELIYCDPNFYARDISQET